LTLVLKMVVLKVVMKVGMLDDHLVVNLVV
jgi:hypothetical protein